MATAATPVGKSKDKTGPGVRGAELFKEGKFEEAVVEFTKFLKKTNLVNDKKKIAHYNRGMAHHNLGHHKEALKDGEVCIKMDFFWAKGYKCKGLALEGMGRQVDAIETLLDGQKICTDKDSNTDSILYPLIRKLNKKTGYLKEDLDLLERMKTEKYCVVCHMFEKDGKVKNKEFLNCERCCMVSYCGKIHTRENRNVHQEVCDQLLKMKNSCNQQFEVRLIWWAGMADGIMFLLAWKVHGTFGQQVAMMMNKMSLGGEHGDVAFDLKMNFPDLMPLQAFRGFPQVNEAERDELRLWDDFFSQNFLKTTWEQMEMTWNMVRTMFPSGANNGNLITDVKEWLSEALTDPMTVFYIIKQSRLFDPLDEREMTIHVVGAEVNEELMKVHSFYSLLSSSLGLNLRLALIGPLLINPPEQQAANKAITIFVGTYQEFLLANPGNYKSPDLIVAFYPGIHDPTYNWMPVLGHVIAKKVPFLVTCSTKQDYIDTKDYLEKRSREGLFHPEIVLDCPNPFASMKAVRSTVGNNEIIMRNMFCILIVGGNIRKLAHLQNYPQLMGIHGLTDLLQLKNMGML